MNGNGNLHCIENIIFYSPLISILTDRKKQVAQLWQRDRAKLDTFSNYFQHYLQNHKITFLGHTVGASRAMQALYMKVLMQRNFVAEFH